MKSQVAINRNQGFPYSPMNFHGANIVSRHVTRPKKQSQSIKEGYSFQDKLGADLSDCLTDGWVVLEEFWIRFTGKKRRNGSTIYHASPDFILLNIKEGKILVVDAKRSHTDSYCQIWKYMALLRSMFPKKWWQIAGCEIHKHERSSGFAGEHEWVGEEFCFKSFSWQGNGFPKIGVITWSGMMRII